MSKQRIYYLDFVRALAISGVIIIHYDLYMGVLGLASQSVLDMIQPLRSTGVHVQSLFTALSGAALMLTYSRKERAFQWAEYIRKRFLSIFPLFWVTYAITYVALSIIHGEPVRQTGGVFTWLLTVTAFDGWLLQVIPTNYIVGEWFLGFILLLYAIFPFLLKLYHTRPWLLAVAGVAGPVLVQLIPELAFGMNPYTSPIARLGEFVWGMFFMRLFGTEGLRRHALGAGSLVAALVLGGWVFPVFPTLLTDVLIGVCVFNFMAWAGLFATAWAPLQRFFVWASLYSYGAFLAHHQTLKYVLDWTGFSTQTLVGFYLQFAVLWGLIFGLGYLLTKLTGALVRRFLHMRPSRARERFKPAR